MRPKTVALLALLALTAPLLGPADPRPRLRSAAEGEDAGPSRVLRAYARLPLRFEQNRGQADPAVDFVARTSGATLFLTPAGAALVPSEGNAVVRLRLVGSKARPEARGLDRIGLANYFIGSDPARWRTGIPTYARVVYDDVYPGVDLVWHGDRSGRVEFDFEVAPGADPGPIRLAYRGAEGLRVTSGGELLARLPGGDLRQARPTVYQEGGGDRRPVSGRYVLLGGNEVGFRLGRYDPTLPLVIDPVLLYSSFLGGSSYDEAKDVAVDAAGNAYVVGHTETTNFPESTEDDFPTTPGSFQPSFGGYRDAFVVKLDPTGSSLVYSSYLGGFRDGIGDDYGYGVAVDDAGNAYVTGYTASTDFPVTPGAFQTEFGGGSYDAFVAKVNPTGSALLYSSFLGGGGGGEVFGNDYGWDIAVDGEGSAFVTGETSAPDFPVTPGAYQPLLNGGGPDAFVTKVAQDGASLTYATFLGGSAIEEGLGIAVDGEGRALVGGLVSSLTGLPGSADFPVTPGAAQPLYGGGLTDAFVARLRPGGLFLADLEYSTYLGGNRFDIAYGIDVDPQGNAYAAGYTKSRDFPVTDGAFQTSFVPGDFTNAFVTKLDPEPLAGLAYSTLLGGSFDDLGFAIDVDGTGRAAVTGYTQSEDFPTTPDAVQGALVRYADAFITRLDPAGAGVVYSTYLGGGNADIGTGIAVDASGGFLLAGETGSEDFPTTSGAFQTEYGGANNPDAFVAKIAEVPTADLALAKSDSADPAPTARNLTYRLTVTSNGPDSASAVTVMDELPPSVTFVSVTPTQGTCGESGGTVTCNLGAMGSGATATIDIVVKPTSPGTLTNTASVSASTLDTNTDDNADSEDTAVCRRTSRRTSVPCG